MSDNPFTPHLPSSPAHFVNREREVDLIFGHVSAVQRGSVSVNGSLGMGKTSLLRYIADPVVGARYGAGPPDVSVLYVDIQSVTPFTGDRFWRRVARLLRRSEHFGLDDAAEQLLNRPVIDVIDLEEFLDAIADAGRSLVLLLDEFEWALQADTAEAEAESRNFLAQMASLMRRTPRVLSLVVATEAPLVEATRVIESWRGSPFATLFTSVTLRPLGRPHTDALLDKALDGGGEVFSEKDRELLHSISGGIPVSLHAAAFRLYHGRQRGVAESALWDGVEAASDAALVPQQEVPSENGKGPHQAPEPETPGLHIDRTSGEVFVDGTAVEALTALEYNLLECLYRNSGKLCTKEDIVADVWGEDLADDSRVEKLVSRLRRKIEPVPGRPQYIRTVRGRGYRLVTG